MKLTTKGRYAVMVMLDLTIHSQNKPVSLSQISNRQSISISYLEQMFAQLRKSALVSSTRGPGGGYKLARAPETVFISEILDAINEKKSTKSDDDNEAITDNIWRLLSGKIHNFLGDISLAKLVRDHQAMQQKGNQNQKHTAPQAHSGLLSLNDASSDMIMSAT